jgi:hypothetical protein
MAQAAKHLTVAPSVLVCAFAVYKAVCKRSNQVVVLKSYQLSAICELYQHQIFREVALHASLKHEHVVQLSGAFQVSFPGI